MKRQQKATDVSLERKILERLAALGYLDTAEWWCPAASDTFRELCARGLIDDRPGCGNAMSSGQYGLPARWIYEMQNPWEREDIDMSDIAEPSEESKETRIRLRCRVGLHQWGRWSEKKLARIGAISLMLGVSMLDENVYTQEKTCKDCGLIRVRTVR